MPDVDCREPQTKHVERDEAKLRQEQQELRQIVDLIPQTIVILDPEGRPIYANQVALEYTGQSLDEVRADNFRDRVFHPEDIQRLREARQKGLSGTVPFENEQRALGKDSSSVFPYPLRPTTPILRRSRIQVQKEPGRYIRLRRCTHCW